MKWIVCIKQTFDTEERIVVEQGQVAEDGMKWVMNPYDEYALEEAIRLKEQYGGEVIAVTVGPDRAETVLRTALAAGADRAVLIADEAGQWQEPVVLAKLLAAVIRPLAPSLLLTGYMAVDSGAGQIGPRLAEELGLAHLAAVIKLELAGETVLAERDVEGGTEVVETSLPLLVTAQQGLNDPRYPSLPGIMKAKKKPLDRVSPEQLGLKGLLLTPATEVVEQYAAPSRLAGHKLNGSPSEQAAALVRLLREEVKVV